MSTDPRQLALAVLNRINSGDITLDAAIEQVTAGKTFKSSRDRSLFNSLVYGTLRWRRRIDHTLAHFADRPLKKIQPQVLNVLRIGVSQITHLDRIPTSAAVNTAVNLARTISAPWAAPFVNAVLRKIGKDHALVPFPPSEDNSAAAVALNHSFPEWLIDRWLKQFGDADTVRLCDAINRPASVTLRANTLKTGVADLLIFIRDLAPNSTRTDYAPDGIRINQSAKKLFPHTIFKTGLCAVQDEAAQLVGMLVDPQPGERVLDGCAGLGGKSGHLAQLMQNRGKVIAVDPSAARIDKLAAEMKRLGVTIVEPLPLKLDEAVSTGKIEGPFDRILIDAPCSGLGVLRRKPDIKWSPLKSDLVHFQRLQSELLEQAAPLLKKNGIMVYAVCSSEPEETEAVVSVFLKNHPEFGISPRPEALAQPRYESILSGGFFQTYPKQVEMDGFFGVRFKRVQ